MGDIVIDLYTKECPKAALNFLKLCKMKYYNNCLCYDVQKDYLVQLGHPTNTGTGGTSIWGLLSGRPDLRYFEDELSTHRNFNRKGLVGMSNKGPNMNASSFFITLSDSLLPGLHKSHTIIGEVAEGLDVLQKINTAYCDLKGRPFQNIRVKHTLVIEDPYEDIPGMRAPSRSPSPVLVKKKNLFLTAGQEEDPNEYPDYLEDDVDIKGMMEGKTEKELEEEAKEHQTKTRAAVLEILEDLPDADVEPPKNVLFVCKLNPVTQSHDLELIFSRFGTIKSCEVIRDWKTGDSLQYAFIEFENEEACIRAYERMEGVLIDERRIHVDFSQSVAKLWNTHRRRTMKQAAEQILERENKLYKVAEVKRGPEQERRRSRERGGYHHRERSRDRRRSKERDHKKSRRRSSSSSSYERRKKKYKKHSQSRSRSRDRKKDSKKHSYRLQ